MAGSEVRFSTLISGTNSANRETALKMASVSPSMFFVIDLTSNDFNAANPSISINLIQLPAAENLDHVTPNIPKRTAKREDERK